MQSEQDVRTGIRVKTLKTRRWKVVLYNDDTTPYEIVVLTLIKFFELDESLAESFATSAQEKGSAVVGEYPEKVAKGRVQSAVGFVHTTGGKDFRMEAVQDA